MLKINSVSFSVEEVFENFLCSKRSNGIKEKTIQTYIYHFNVIKQYLEPKENIESLRKQDIEQAILAIKNTGISCNSIRSYTATLKSFLSWCNEEQFIDFNIKLFKGMETIKDTYTDEELKTLLIKPNIKKCSFSEYRNWVIINFLLNSGCRASTIRNILIKDVDLENDMVKFRHTKNQQYLMVPLCLDMKKILKEYLKIRGGQPNSFLFPNQEDKQMTENCLSQAIRKYNKKRGINKTSIHLFRHSYAERYLRNGGNAFHLQKILGHTTLAMTRHYCKIYNSDIINNYDSFSPLQTLKRH